MIPSRINSSSHQQQLSSQDGDYLNPSDAMPSLSRLTGSEVIALNLSNNRPFAASLGFPSSLSPSVNPANSVNQVTSMNQATSVNQPSSNYDLVLREGEKLRANIFKRQDSFFGKPLSHYENSQVADGYSEVSSNPISQNRIQLGGDSEELKASPKIPLIGDLQVLGQKAIFKPGNNRHHFTATGHDFYSSTTQDGNGLRSSTQGGNQSSSTGGPQYAGLSKGNNNFASNTNSNTFNNMNVSQSISGQIGSLLDSSNEIQLNKQDMIWINNNLKNPSSKFKNGQIPLSRRVDTISPDDNVNPRNNSLSNPNNQNNLSNINDRSNINNLIDKINEENSDFIEKKNKRLSKLSIQNSQANKISFKLFKKANLIKKFVHSLLKILPSRILDKLEYKHFQIIGDVIFQASHSKPPSNEADADYLGKSQKTITSSSLSQWPSIHRKLKRAFSKMTSSLSETLPIFSPNGLLLVVWNTFLLVFLMAILIINPLLATFESSTSNKFLLIITEQCSIAVFGIQILLNFNTGFYHEGEIIKSRYIIFRKYFQLYFWIDILSIIAILFSISYDIQYLKLVALIRIPQIFRILDSTEEHFQLQQKFYTTYELTKLFALVFFVAHYCSCTFYEISRFDYENNANKLSWIQKYNVATEGWGLIYLDALYFSFITMVTVGFGDIVPISVNEKIYVIFFTLVSCGIFGYAVNTIGAIFQELSQKQASYKLKKYEITQYMQGRGIERAPQIKVLKYLEYMNTQEEERNFLLKGEKILQTVSKNLREEVMLNFFGQILQNSVIFKDTFSQRLIEQLALRMKEVTLGPGDTIFSQGDIDNRLFYVFKGQVDYCLEYDHKVIKFGSYKVGEFFGQSGFFADIPRVFTAKSKGTTHIVICKQEDMDQLIKENPLDLESFCLIRDEMLFKENYIGHKCQSCGSTEHIEIQCDLINLHVNKPVLIRKNNYSVDQERSGMDRHRTEKFRSRKLRKLVAIHLKQFRAACVLEALENWEDLGILQDPKATDQDFFLGFPKVKYEADSGQMCQDSEDSLYSDEDIHIFSKDEMKISQDQESRDSLIASTNLPEISLMQKSSQHQHIRPAGMKSRHQSTKENSGQIEEIKDWNQMFRSKTKKETFVGSPSSRTKRVIPEPVHSTETLEPATRTENRHNTGEKSHVTGLQRGDSMSSIKSFHKRSASRNMSRFGAAAVAVANSANSQLVSSNPKIEPLHPPSGDKTVPISKGDSQVKATEKGSEQFKDIYINGQVQQYVLNQEEDYEFDVMKEYTIYYPNNNLSQILRQIKKTWLDKFQKKRIKSKSTYKSKPRNSKSSPSKLKKHLQSATKTIPDLV